MTKKKFKIATLGCRTNQYESQAYADQLSVLGYEEAVSGEADLCIVNTCTVTQSADKRSVAAIRKLMRENPGSEVVVTGCLSKELEGFDERVKVVPNGEKEKLIEVLFPGVENLPEFSIKNFDAHTRAFVKIQDGCNSYCSYCIIPYVRGRSRVKPVPEILKEIAGLIENGYKEIVLTGINIGDFEGLPSLIRQIDQMEGLERIRVSSIDPDEVDADLLDAIVNGKKTCHSMHIVLQAGSNSVLTRMRRKYTRQDFFATINKLKAASKDFTFTTDIIVGFPGETDEEFEETCDVIKEVRFAKVHMFPYSDRPKTRASRMPNKVPKEIIEKRRQSVLKLSSDVAYKLREDYVGRTMPILLESPDPERPGYIRGHTENFLLVSVPNEGLRSNQTVTAKLTENHPDCLVGVL